MIVKWDNKVLTTESIYIKDLGDMFYVGLELQPISNVCGNVIGWIPFDDSDDE